MTGIRSECVISAASVAGTHSSTNEKQPAAWLASASFFIRLRASSLRHHIAGAQIVSENVRKKVEAALFSKARIPVTISLGIAEYPLHTNTLEGLLRRADQALYEAKDAGRNCCYRHGGPEPAIKAK